RGADGRRDGGGRPGGGGVREQRLLGDEFPRRDPAPLEEVHRGVIGVDVRSIRRGAGAPIEEDGGAQAVDRLLIRVVLGGVVHEAGVVVRRRDRRRVLGEPRPRRDRRRLQRRGVRLRG